MNVPITIDDNLTLADVVDVMLDKKISRVLVTENEKIKSIVTEKDIGLFLLEDKSDRTLHQIQLNELAKPVLTTTTFMTIKECAKKMLENNIGSLAIASDDKDVVGIITKTDLVSDFVKNYQKKKTVGEYMSAHYSWVYSDDLLSKVVAKMSEQGISRLIVHNKSQVPIGIITFRDLFELVKTMVSQRETIFPKNFESEHGLGKTLHADEVMKNEIITVGYDDDLAKASQIILDNKINGIGVISNKGDMIGILSKTDIVKAIATLD